MKKVGIFLKSGFGNLGFGSGALKVLIACLGHHNIEIVKLIGCSAGSFAIPSFAIRRPDRVSAAWFNLKPSDVSRFKFQHPFHGLSILNPASLEKYTKQFIEPDLDLIFSEKAIPFEIITTDLKTGNGVYFQNTLENKSRLIDICMASAGIVPFFPPRTIDNLILVDGAFSDDLPLKRFMEAGCDIVFVVDLYDGLPAFDNNPKKAIWPEFLLRMMQINTNQHSRLRLDLSERINKELEVVREQKLSIGVVNKLCLNGLVQCNVQFVIPAIPIRHISFRDFTEVEKWALPAIGYWAAKTTVKKLGIDYEGV